MVLAGGLGRRMGGGDKALRPFGGEGTLLDAVLARLGPLAWPVAVNANGEPARFARWGLPVLPDPVEGRPGPLAGILAAMDWAGALGAETVLTVPCDAPFLPADLLERLLAAAAPPGVPVVAASGGRWHPVAGLWPVALAGTLRVRLAEGERRVEGFARGLGARAVAFEPAPGAPDPFLNCNSPEDLAAAVRLRPGRDA